MTAVQGFDRVEELPERPGQAVELPDHQRIVGTHVVERGVQLRTVALGATGFFGKDALAPRGVEGIELQGEVLIVGRDTSIANGHGHG
jgi:hypothetical protein